MNVNDIRKKVLMRISAAKSRISVRCHKTDGADKGNKNAENAKNDKLTDNTEVETMDYPKETAARMAMLSAGAVLSTLAFMAGCATSEPASRLTKGGETRIEIAGSNHKITMTIDSSVASSSDSHGSTETTHASPTNTTSVPIEVRYNDALKTATQASQNALSQIGGGLGAVLDLMLNKGTGTVNVTKKDGTKATVKCENGQCEFTGDAGLQDVDWETRPDGSR